MVHAGQVSRELRKRRADRPRAPRRVRIGMAGDAVDHR